MKKSNRLPIRVLAFVMTLVMLFSFSATALAADVEIAKTDYYTVSYDSSTGTPNIVLTMNADKLGQFVHDRNFTKEELKKFLPDIFAKALENKTLPSFQELLNFFPQELYSYDELTKLFPEKALKTILSDQLFEELLTDDVINKLLTDEVLEALLTKQVLDALLTDDVLERLLAGGVLEDLLADGTVLEDLLADGTVLEDLLADGTVLEDLLADGTILEDLLADGTVLEDLLADGTILEDLLADGTVLEDLLADGTILEDLLADGTILEDLLADGTILEDLLNEGTILEDLLREGTVLEDLLNEGTALQELFTETVIKSMIGQTEALGFVNGGYIDSDDVLNLLKSEELALVSAEAPESQQQKAIELALANHADELAALLKANVTEDVVLSVVGIDKVIDTVTLDAIVEKITLDRIVDEIGLDVIIDEIGLDVIIDEIGLDAIIDEIGLDAIINEIGLDVIIDEIGLDAIIDEIGLDVIIDEIGLDVIIDKIGLDVLIDAIGLDVIIDKIGLDVIIDKIGLDVIIDKIGLDVIIDKIGLDVIIDKIGLDNIIAKVGLDNIIAKIGLDTIIAKVGLDNIISTVGLNNIISTVGIDRIISTVGLENIISAVDKTVLKEQIVNAVVRLFSNQLESISISTSTNGSLVEEDVFELIETNSTFEMRWNLNDLINVVASSIPSVDTLANLNDGDVVYDINFKMNFLGMTETAGFGVTFKVEGDTTLVNAYAQKIFSMVDYQINTGLDLALYIDDSDADAPVLFADLMTKVLEADSLTDVEKAEVFDLFNLTGNDLINGLENFDIQKLADRVGNISAGTVSTLETLRDKTIDVIKRLMARIPAYVGTISFANIYEMNGTFAIQADGAVETTAMINKIASVLGTTLGDFLRDCKFDEVISGSVDFRLHMQNVYRVRYCDENGACIYTTFLPVGAKLSVINDNVAVLSGKAPDGWKDIDTAEVVDVMPAKDLELRANVASKTHTATFMADGKVVAVVQFTEGDIVLSIVPAVPAKKGFDGVWAPYTLGDTDIIINAIYTPRTHQITFVAEGKIVAKVTFKEGDTMVSAPQVPFKLGYHGRWENYVLGEEDIVVRAVYTNQTYSVTFDPNGGEGVMPMQKLSYDIKDALYPNTFTREGYTFASWNTKADGTGISYMDQTVVMNLSVSQGVTLYAQWNQITPDTRTVTFMANGVVVDKVTFEIGDTELSRVPAVPERAGYIGVWAAYSLGEYDITVNAVYTAKSYSIVFDANGGFGSMDRQDMSYDVFLALNKNTFTKEGYEFIGWNTKADGSGTSFADGENVKNLAQSGDVTLYAQWKEAEETTTETTTTETTTVATTEEIPEESGFNWLVLVIILAVLAVAGGVVGFLIYKKKKA